MTITITLRHHGPGPHPSGTPQKVHGKEEASGSAGGGGIVPCVAYRPREEDVQRAIDISRERIEQSWADHDQAIPEYWEDRALLNLGKWMKKYSPSIQTPIGVALRILSAGRFKTQFETGASSGMYDPDMRTWVEQEAMGVPKDIEKDVRPVYGQLRPPSAMTTQYGDVEFVLKDAVRARCTYTVGDSMGGYGGRSSIAAPLGQPALETMSDLSAEDASCLYWDVPEEFMHNGEQYVEVQVHGGVRLSDVESINLLNLHVGREAHDEVVALAKKALALGIKVNVPRGVSGKAQWDKKWKAESA